MDKRKGTIQKIYNFSITQRRMEKCGRNLIQYFFLYYEHKIKIQTFCIFVDKVSTQPSLSESRVNLIIKPEK